MKLTSVEAILLSLQAASVRYLVVGGLAVAAHGHGRATFDIDLVVQLQADNVSRALNALGALGYRPTGPVPAAQFSDPQQRELWIRDKNMVMFQLHSDRHPETQIDLFVSEPFDFDAEYDRAMIGEFLPELPVRFVCLDTLERSRGCSPVEIVEYGRQLMSDNNPKAPNPSVAWREHDLAQLRHFRSLSLHARFEAVQGMADVVRRLQDMRRQGKLRSP